MVCSTLPSSTPSGISRNFGFSFAVARSLFLTTSPFSFTYSPGFKFFEIAKAGAGAADGSDELPNFSVLNLSILLFPVDYSVASGASASSDLSAHATSPNTSKDTPSNLTIFILSFPFKNYI